MQVLGEYMFFQAILATVVYVGIFLWAAWQIGLSFGGYEVLLLLEYLVCGTIINSGIYLIFNCLNFWLIQGGDMAVLVQTCREFVKYPLNVFPAAIQGFFTFLLPLGFVAYYPAMALLGKTTLPVELMLPAVGVFVVFLAFLVWRAGLKGYNSTGT